ncbi:hypothetical protein C805_02523 [Eubacterium sp. 14-2]|uniref:DUF6483 family protein n=1 Tax=Eubacterium sp. 14-2 TaxID=1235790 RepID=UPI0003398169|nr:DUF6483 family protein [Eubacterium sp. 14-2]EOT24311.1 hypothetical protein C805_02523 [Eubacterium sp. 14-2]
MVEKDYIMRMIHEMVRTILKLIFHIDEEKQELVFLEGKDQDFYQRLCLLADQGKINEAENMLYEHLEDEFGQEETEHLENLKLSLAFYDYLNEKTGDFLEDHDFSREEVAEGIKSVMKRYGYSGLAETLLENQ